MGSAPAHPPTPLSAQLLIPARQVNDLLTSITPPSPLQRCQSPTNRSETFDKQLLGVVKAVTHTNRMYSWIKGISSLSGGMISLQQQRLPTCVVTLTGSAGLFFGLTALVFGPSVSLGHQRRNGLPKKLGLGLGGRNALFLDFCQSFLLVQTGRRSWS